MSRLKALFTIDYASPAVRQLLDEQEMHGARVSNYFRYGFLVMSAASLFANAGLLENPDHRFWGLVINSTALALFLFVNLGQTWVIRKGDIAKLHAYNYISMLMDFFIISCVIFSWGYLQSPSNINYMLKNPGIYYYFIPIMLTLIQFRPRPVLVAVLLFLGLYFGTLFWGLLAGIPVAPDWVGYALGDSLYLPDALTSKPTVFIMAGGVILYTISRTSYMVNRIGKTESQKSALSRYFSPDIVSEITKSPEQLFQGKRQQVTILFQDIRSFTAMSEKMSTEELTSFLNNFRERMTKIIFKHHGTLDKYIGDAIMATFGTPQVSENDASNALNAALAMHAELKLFNQERAEQGKTPVQMGIGLHSGEVFAGNLGFEGRLEYTVIGDAVNAASRIEHLCKKFQAEIILSEQTLAQVKNISVAVTKLPALRVRGKETIMQLYKVVIE